MRTVGELFGSRAQVTRIEQLEREVAELRELVHKVASGHIVESFPRGICRVNSGMKLTGGIPQRESTRYGVPSVVSRR